MTPEQMKSMVREKYSRIARDWRDVQTSCCGTGPSGCSSEFVVQSEDYSSLQGYVPDADLGLGCGLPTRHANIQEGDTVVDLGSGAGNDSFVSRAIVGDKGRVIGIDSSEEMIKRSRDSAARCAYTNVEFRHGDIEDIPLANNIADVMISNCVLNLVPDKEKAFAEMFRVLKPGGRFSVSDVVHTGSLPLALRESAEMYTGCIGGTIELNRYLDIIRAAGFINVNVLQQKPIPLPRYIPGTESGADRRQSDYTPDTGLLSITVYGTKPIDVCCDNSGTCCPKT